MMFVRSIAKQTGWLIGASKRAFIDPRLRQQSFVVKPTVCTDSKRREWLQLDRYTRFKLARDADDESACAMTLLHKGIDEIRRGEETDGVLTLQHAHEKDASYTAIASLTIVLVYTRKSNPICAKSHFDVAFGRLFHYACDRERMSDFYDIIPFTKPVPCECGKRMARECWGWHDGCVSNE